MQNDFDGRAAIENFLDRCKESKNFGPYSDAFANGYLKGMLSDALFTLSLYNRRAADTFVTQLNKENV